MKNQTNQSAIEWKEVALGEITENMHQGINTVTEKINYRDKGYPIIQSKHITRGSLNLSDARFLDKKDFDFYKDKYHPKNGDVLICNIGTIGKSIVIRDKQDFLIAWNLFLIKLQKDKISPDFFKFYLDELYSKKLFDKMLSGGTVKFINKSKMENIKIPLPFRNNHPDLETQQKIVAILEKAEQLKEKRKQALKLLDEYLKSVFNEMFVGKGFEKRKGNELFELAYGKGLSDKERDGGKYQVYGSNGVVGNHSNYLVEGPGIIIGRKGSIGEINFTKDSFWPIDTTYYIKPKEKFNLIFLFYLLKIYNLKLNTSTAIPGLNRNDVYSMSFIYPPLPLQQTFASIVEHVEKLKETQKKSLQEIETLFNALMQKAFNGELIK